MTKKGNEQRNNRTIALRDNLRLLRLDKVSFEEYDRELKKLGHSVSSKTLCRIHDDCGTSEMTLCKLEPFVYQEMIKRDLVFNTCPGQEFDWKIDKKL